MWTGTDETLAKVLALVVLAAVAGRVAASELRETQRLGCNYFPSEPSDSSVWGSFEALFVPPEVFGVSQNAPNAVVRERSC